LTTWTVSTERGDAAAFHGREPAPDTSRSLWWFDVTRPALVLGSSQPIASVDVARCEDDGIDVVRRRSGGGAVLMLPGDIVWLDVVVPAGDEHWDDDVGRAMWWLGDRWASALVALGVRAPEVHRGGLVSTAWSRLVCFDGVGAGEVLVEGRKAVGISQRRTRHWIRLQCAVHRRWRADLHRALLRSPASDVGEPAEPWCLPADVDDVDLRRAVEAAVTA
jgi:lipoate-protein ligase A